MPRIPLLLVALLIAACQSGPTRKAPSASAAATGAVAATAFVEGRAFYLERIAAPPDATLDVQLIANAESDHPVTIARRSFGDLRGPPYDFTLPYDPAGIDGSARYSLRAALRNGHGHLEFYTPTRVAVTPDGGQRIEVRLQRSAGP